MQAVDVLYALGLQCSGPCADIAAAQQCLQCDKAACNLIVNLLCRFYEPTAGAVLINGVDYRRRSLGWHQRQLGIVLQTPHLFSGTVRENIRYGKLEASEDEIIAAAELAGAHDFILENPHGYDAEVGEGGNRLSTGQKQLVALARAIALDPQILMYDEPFVGQDPIAMGVLVRLIRLLNDALGITSIVVSHDLAETASIADYIYVVGDGQVLGQGTPDELMGSDNPRIRQFMKGDPDGPVPFHFPAPDYRADLLGAR